MAKGDIAMRLILKDEDFRKKIKDSKKEVDGFKGVGQQAFGKVGVALKGLAAAAGAVKVAVEGFKVVVGSSQALTDAWGRSLEAMKISFDNFVYSLANADFTSVNAGLEEMARRGAAVYDAFDQLNNTKMSTQFVQRYYQMLYKQAETVATDKNATREEREKALNQMEAYANRINLGSQTLAGASEEALRAKFASKNAYIDPAHISRSLLLQAFEIDSNPDFAAKRRAWSIEYETYLTKSKAIADQVNKEAREKFPTSMIANNGQIQIQRQKFVSNRESELQRELASRYRGAITYNIALQMQKDEAFTQDLETFLLAAESSNTGQELLRSVAERRNQFMNETKSTGDAVAAAPRSRFTLGKMQTYNPAMPSQTPGADELPTTITSPFENEKMKGWADATIYNAAVENMKKVEEGANSLGDSFNALGGAIGGSAGSLLSFAGSTLEAIGAVIPFISLLQAEAIQHNVNATAAMKEAAAKTLAAYSGIPFAGVALGVAAVSAIVGTLQALPALAEGGIATGPTMALIGEAGKEAVLPLDKLQDFVNLSPREVHVTGEVRASGKDLVVAIDNYNKVRRVK